jgi:hypothetical protein
MVKWTPGSVFNRANCEERLRFMETRLYGREVHVRLQSNGVINKQPVAGTPCTTL